MTADCQWLYLIPGVSTWRWEWYPPSGPWCQTISAHCTNNRGTLVFAYWKPVSKRSSVLNNWSSSGQATVPPYQRMNKQSLFSTSEEMHTQSPSAIHQRRVQMNPSFKAYWERKTEMSRMAKVRQHLHALTRKSCSSFQSICRAYSMLNLWFPECSVFGFPKGPLRFPRTKSSSDTAVVIGNNTSKNRDSYR